ncbi:hypothetical protein TNCV_712041 [Trichonephila clavipes]|nr:hypothetical protein TNCV_712041 [Trichonephila clavipes]
MRGLLATNLVGLNHGQVKRTTLEPALLLSKLPHHATGEIDGFNMHQFLCTTGVAAVTEWYRYRIVAGFVTSSSPVSLKTRRVGQRCTLYLSRAETYSRWCGI